MEEKIPEKMKAALLLGTGGPEMLEIRDDVSVPVVQQDQVLVKVSACGLNNARRDIAMHQLHQQL